jgi:hypothetical protein
VRELIRKILREETDDENLSQNHPIIKGITKVIGNEYNGVVYQPWDEGYHDYIIKFHISKVTMWSTTGYEENDPFLRSIYHPKPNSLFEGSVYVKVDVLLVGNQRADKWEKMYGKDDITETAWDDFTEHISDTIAKWMPGVNVDVDISF